MNKSMLAGAALVAVAAVAAPAVVAWSQSSPSPPPAGGSGAGPMDDHMGGPRMMHGGEMGRMMMREHMNEAPRQACIDRLAHRAGFVASMGFKLNLTAEQKPLWDKVLAATQAAQDNQRKLCEVLPANAADRDKLTVIDLMNHRQQMLQAQLQGLQQAQPAVQALYDKLTPEQKAIIDHPFRRG